MKVYLILEYNSEDKCKVHSVYLHIEKAMERVFHLMRKQESSCIGSANTYHVIKKSVKGNVLKAIKKGLISA